MTASPSPDPLPSSGDNRADGGGNRTAEGAARSPRVFQSAHPPRPERSAPSPLGTRAPLSAPVLPLVLYDGECGLCSRSVQAILRWDPAGHFHFTPLQSPLGQRLLTEANLPTQDFDTLVLVDAKGAVRQRSDAVLGILAALPRWRWTVIGWAIPRVLRDAAYAWIARRRHRLFRRPSACMTLRPEWRRRFLD